MRLNAGGVHHSSHMNKPTVFLDQDVEGVELALRNNHIVVIVDVFSFSTAVTTAIANGFTIYPVSDRERGQQLAEKTGAELAGKRGEAKYSLSPLTYLNPDQPANKIVLYSPNGAACCEMVKDRTAFIGCFLNAKAVGKKVTRLAKKTNQNVTVVMAGEQRAVIAGDRVEYIKESTRKVFALEDFLGAGAIIKEIKINKSPEAIVCESAFKKSSKQLHELLTDSFSGRYLVQKSSSADIDFSIQLNRYDSVPKIKDNEIINLN